jgi:hypothetical protein
MRGTQFIHRQRVFPTAQEPTMNANRTQRLVAAFASAVTTLALFTAIVAQAQPPVANSLLAQAGSVRVA